MFPAQPLASFLEDSFLLPCLQNTGGCTTLCCTGEGRSQALQATPCCLTWHASGHCACRKCALHTYTHTHIYKRWVMTCDSNGPYEQRWWSLCSHRGKSSQPQKEKSRPWSEEHPALTCRKRAGKTAWVVPAECCAGPWGWRSIAQLSFSNSMLMQRKYSAKCRMPSCGSWGF